MNADLLPLTLGPFDHYTLIVDDAAAVARFHCEVLGFEQLRIQKVNAGSAPAGEFDMLNYVLQTPGSSRRVVVITEGLNERSIFSRYLKAYGAGVHHVAYSIDYLDGAVETLRTCGVETTSAEVLVDPLTGLRQIFISREHGGYFIELIERTAVASAGTFTNDNMAALAQTMMSYLEEAPETRAEPVMPEVHISMPRNSIVKFLLDPFNLPLWTAHRTVRKVNTRVVEVRMYGDVGVEVAEHPHKPEVHFIWSKAGGEFRVRFAVEAVPGSYSTRVRALIPELPAERAARTLGVIEAELAMLKALFDGDPDIVTPEQRALVDDYHLEIYQRRGV